MIALCKDHTQKDRPGEKLKNVGFEHRKEHCIPRSLMIIDRLEVDVEIGRSGEKPCT